MKKLLTLAILLSLTSPALAEEMKMRDGSDHKEMAQENNLPENAVKKENKKILYWVAPMDPEYRRDEPGKSPMGMDLIPVYEDDGNHK